MKFKEKKTVWISWHRIPRSRNISKYLNIPIVEYFENGSIFKRHLYSSVWTIKYLLKNKPEIVFLHYSYLLLYFTVLYKKFINRKLIVIADCHNKALRRKLNGFGTGLYEKIKKYSFKNTDITIITNEGMIKDILNYHNNYFILPDKIPEFKVELNHKKEKKYCVYISSFSIDEPVEEIIETAKILGNSVTIYWTGKKTQNIIGEEKIPSNIIFTGYLEYNDYYKLISNADCLLLLTTEDDCLQCGAYEGLNAGVPMVISDNKASREYFEDSAIYTKIKPQEISASILTAIEKAEVIKNNSKLIKEKREKDFERIIKKLILKIESII